MLKNQRKKVPYISAGIIFLCIAVLAFLEIRGLKEAGETTYIPVVRLYATKEESMEEYVRTDKLPLCYQFGQAGYQVDIPGLDYQSTESGIATEVSDSLWLYIAEYDSGENGINMALGELPPFFLGSVYNRSGSYVAMEKTQEGYLAGLEVEYTFAEVNLAMAQGREVAGSIAVFDFTVGDRGVCIIGMTTDYAKQARDACRDRAWEIALTMRPDPDFAMRDKEDDPAYRDGENASMECRIEEVAVAELSRNGEPPDRWPEDGLKSQYTEPVPTLEPVPSAEPVPVPEKTPASKPMPSPVPVLESQPVPGCETGSILQPPFPDPADINEQSFHAPLTGVAMSITVTLGSSGGSAVTVLCPDGAVLESASVDGCVYSFYTTAQEGAYIVVTTGYAAAGSVSVHVHCG